MENPHQILDDLKPEKEFFIGIDSDGCAFDTMEIKQKECFCPNTIKFWNLQAVSKYARETVEFVNLYSKSRGINRFPALVEVMDLLRERPEVIARNARIPDMTPLVEWISKETMLGNPALEKYKENVNDPIITNAYNWSVAVNKTIKKIVYGIPPFPFVRESLIKLAEKADAVVVSQTPLEALKREWEEHDIDQYIRIMCGQEYGTKAEHIRYAAKGKYPDDKILMIGDAPGDFKAAKSNGVLFFSVNPGNEEASWERFYNEALDRFFEGTYAGEYEEALIKEFDAYLPGTPPWKR
jgi:phosphoglycolate phosphatase-like HAD superfamily hydrolase